MKIENYRGIIIDHDRDDLLSYPSKELLKEKYLHSFDEGSIQKAFARAAICYSYGDLEFAQKIYDYSSKLYFMYSSPVLSNASYDGSKLQGLPISCFLNYCEDSIEGLNNHTIETRLLSVKGGGVGGYWGAVRAASEKAPGVIPFLHTIDGDMTAYRQGKTRRGSYAAYLDISHPDFMEFLTIRVPTGTDMNRKCLNLHQAVNITDDFLDALEHDKDWNFICPNSKEIKGTEKARKVFEEILKCRARTGEPYINYIDEANKNLNPILKERGLKIYASNLCNEIHLPQGRDSENNKMRTAVCCLSSLNLEKYDEWKDTAIVEDLIKFLDNVLQFFIDNCPDSLESARYSADQERSLGLGTMGFHSYLQSKNIPFESVVAKSYNMKIFKEIKEKADRSSSELAVNKTFLITDYNKFINLNTDISEKITIIYNNFNKKDFLKNWNLKLDLNKDENFFISRIFNSIGIFKDAYNYFEKKFKKDCIEIIEYKNFSLKEKFKYFDNRNNICKIIINTEKLKELIKSIGRNSHKIAIAPNSNNSFICSSSPSIEPWDSNGFIHRNRIGSFEIRNKYLDNLIKLKLENPENIVKYNDIWIEIISNNGSIQHLDFFNENEKNVFKTAREIDQRWIIDHARDRQKYICQGQSVNLFFNEKEDVKVVLDVHLRAFKKSKQNDTGVPLKGLYYMRSRAAKGVSSISKKVDRDPLKEYKVGEECLSCSG